LPTMKMILLLYGQARSYLAHQNDTQGMSQSLPV
jgi:hypothetical protein